MSERTKVVLNGQVSSRAGVPGFSIVELLAVIVVLGILAALLLPSLAAASHRVHVAVDKSNLRALQIAHYQYAIDSNGRFADAGLSHGGLENQEIAWLNLIGEHVDIKAHVRSPLDLSPHWTMPIEGTSDRFRRTSYGWNNYLSRTHSPAAAINPLDAADCLSRVKNPSNTIHFLHMTGTGSYAGADHVHIENWWISDAHPDAPAVLASNQVETNIVDGEKGSKTAQSNYGFVDGHVETLSFGKAYTSPTSNRFDPEVAGRSF
ncbi:MAG: prepilin-type N-terminal cleavage/methylation domain-containing protein [Phycisphaerales bacterium]|nr:prepilin-type N-terminal cleavage/methylation domain-containing protein [Phycisphaerales bacterium]